MEFTKSDPLTECFERSLTAILTLETDPCLAVMIVVLDDFKALNETLGHAITDKLLQLASQRLRSALRERDKLLRLPGDEFGILLNPAVSTNDTRIIAERLTGLLERVFLIRGQIINVTASIGIALVPQDGAHPETLLKRASIALQHGKSSGPGTVQFFESAMEDRIIAHHALALDLRKALLMHQLEVHYQPQVDIKIQHLTGFEALLRWHHPELGWISPGEFIPIAEETGLIGMIGDWVLKTACLEAARLPEEIVVAVNASPLQFRTGTFPESVERALSLAGIPAGRLEIEITEGVLLQNSKAVLSTLNELHTLGVRLAMDDFGTGYSALGQLARFPFDTIKIDRSLVIDRHMVSENAKQRAIVRAIATLGAGLGMSTLVEGIETEEQLVNAYLDGCLSAQGYLFGKAVSAAQIDEVLMRFANRFHTPLEATELHRV